MKSLLLQIPRGFLLSLNAIYFGQSPIFLRNILLSKLSLLSVSCLAYPSTLNMEGILSSEMSVSPHYMALQARSQKTVLFTDAAVRTPHLTSSLFLP
jgi:hypothetical protein